MKYFKNSVVMVMVVVLMSFTYVSFVNAKEFNADLALQTYNKAKHIENSVISGMTNNIAINNFKHVVDYLNGNNVYKVCEFALKLASTNIMVGNMVHAIILYDWMELTFQDTRFYIDDEMNKLVDTIMMQISIQKMQIYSSLNQTDKTNLSNFEGQFVDYYNNTPTRAMYYNKTIIDKVYGSM